jgi:pimeloyl-ACP methyl ester carboxylesterase
MGKLLSIQGEAHVELQGYLEDSGRRLLIMHYHGLAGNFYENAFIHHFVRETPQRGFSFLSVNSRAHDHFSDAHLGGSSALLRRGAAHTKLEEVRSDIASWVSYAFDEGFESLVLQGHSAGAVSVADYLLRNNDTRILGAVLASPTDMVGLQLVAHGRTEFEKLLRLARSKMSEGNPRTLMPESSLEGYRFDAETYLNLFQPNGAGDIFDFRDPDRLTKLRAIGRPLLCFFGGGADEVCSVPVANALDSLRRELSPTIDVTTSIIEGASHTYRGFENIVTSFILEWIVRLQV